MSDNLVVATKAALTGEIDSLLAAVHTLAEPLTEKQFWRKPTDPGNSVGHLVLHLTGNLQHFAGARLGKTGYLREREREFTEANPPSKAEALARLDEAVAVYRRVVESLTADQLTAAHPDAMMGSVVNGLLRMATHFALHRRQMSYIARSVEAEGQEGQEGHG